MNLLHVVLFNQILPNQRNETLKSIWHIHICISTASEKNPKQIRLTKKKTAFEMQFLYMKKQQ